MILGMTEIFAPAQEVRLVVESFQSAANGPAPAARGAGRSGPPGVPVPPGVSRLRRGDGLVPALEAVSVSAADGVGILLEPFLAANRQPRLLVLNFAKLVLRVNDDVAPCVSVLKEGDCFRWLDDMALHVGVFRRPPIRPVGEHGAAGRACPVCLVPLTTNDVAYFCACGAAYHCHPAESPGLQCARTLSRCLACEHEMVLRESFSDLPSLCL